MSVCKKWLDLCKICNKEVIFAILKSENNKTLCRFKCSLCENADEKDTFGKYNKKKGCENGPT